MTSWLSYDFHPPFPEKLRKKFESSHILNYSCGGRASQLCIVIFPSRVMSVNQTNFACPDGVLRLGYVRNYYPAFYFDGLYRFRGKLIISINWKKGETQGIISTIGGPPLLTWGVHPLNLCFRIDTVSLDRRSVLWRSYSADRSLPPFDGSLGSIYRKEFYTDVSTDDLDSLQWPHFKTLQPIEFDYVFTIVNF